MAGQLAVLIARRLRVPVALRDVDDERVAAGLAGIRSLVQGMAAKGRLSESEANRILASVTVGVLVWLFRGAIIRAYTPDEAVIAAAMPLFLFIAFYQLFDSVQVTTAFVLRATA